MISLLGMLIPAALLACAIGWTVATKRWVRGRSAVPAEPRLPVPWGLLDLIAALVLLVAFGLLAMGGLALWFGTGFDTPLQQLPAAQRVMAILAQSIASLATMLASITLILLRPAASWADLGLVVGKAWSDIKLGAIAFVMLAPPVYAIQLLLVQRYESKHPLVELLKEAPGAATLLITVLAAVGVAPLVEEYFFRVLLQGWLEKLAVWAEGPFELLVGTNQRATPPTSVVDPNADEFSCSPPLGRASDPVDCDTPSDDDKFAIHVPPDHTADPIGSDRQNPYLPPSECDQLADCADASDLANQAVPYWPVVVSSLVFSLLHLSHGPDWIPLFLLALGLGYLYRQTHRILPCIVVHFLLNACSMALFLIGISE